MVLAASRQGHTPNNRVCYNSHTKLTTSVHLESEMAGKTKRPQAAETPSERFERVAKKALDRGQRAREKQDQKDRDTAVRASQPSP